MNARFLEDLYHRPWLITASGHATLRRMASEQLALPQRDGGRIGELLGMAQPQIVNGVALIPITGPIGTRLDTWDKAFGAVDTLDVTREIEAADRDPEVHTILLDIDSPGGMFTGTPELADRIAQAEKDVYAFTGGMMASAAYWLGASAQAIFATQSADIGSIGVYLAVIDVSLALEQRGIQVEVIKTGEFKGMGYPGTSLTPAQRDYLQASVNESFEMFTSHVRANRAGEILDDTMQGQTFLAKEAAARGLIDEIVPDRAAVLKELSSLTR